MDAGTPLLSYRHEDFTFKTRKNNNEAKKITFKQKLALCMLSAADFLSFISMALMAPFYPKEASEKGISETVSGFVFGFYGFVVFISSPLAGKIIPKFGVKMVFVVGLVLSGVVNMAFGFLEFIDNTILFVVLSFIIRGFQGLGTALYSTASFVLITKIFPDHGGLVRGILEVFVGLGLSAGPPIGGFLFAIGGFGLPFYIVGGIFLVVAPFNKWSIPSQAFVREGDKAGSFRKLFRIPSVFISCVTVAVLMITWSSLNPTLEPYLRRYDLSVSNVGLIFLVLSAAYGIASPVAGYASDKMNNCWILIVGGLFLAGVTLVMLGLSSYIFPDGNLWWDTVCIFFLGMFVGAGLLPTYQAVLDGAIYFGKFEDSVATQSIVAGLWASIYSAGEAVGPICGGALLNHLGFPMMIIIMGSINIVTATVGCALFYKYTRKDKVITDIKPSQDTTDSHL